MMWCVNGIKLSLLLLRPSCFFWGLNLSLRFSFVFKHFYYETLFLFYETLETYWNIKRIYTEYSYITQILPLIFSILSHSCPSRQPFLHPVLGALQSKL